MVITVKSLSLKYGVLIKKSTELLNAVPSNSWEQLYSKIRVSLEESLLNFIDIKQSHQKIIRGGSVADRVKVLMWLSRVAKANLLLFRDSLVLLGEYYSSGKFSDQSLKVQFDKFSIKNFRNYLDSELGELEAIFSNTLLELFHTSLVTGAQNRKGDQLFDKRSFATRKLIDQLPRIGKLISTSRSHFAARKMTKSSYGVLDRLALVSKLKREFISLVLSNTMFSLHELGLLNILPEQKVKPQYMPFTAVVPNGKDIAIKDMGDQQVDDFIQIRGRVLTIDRIVKDKYMGVLLTLEDTKGNASLPIEFLFSNPIEYGVKVGTYCNINGYVKDSSKLSDQSRHIRVDVLEMKTALSKSWRYFILSLSDEYYKTYPNNLNITFFSL